MVMRISVVLATWLHIASAVSDDCKSALGMHSYDIPNSALTASSSYGSEVGPQTARLGKDDDGGAWCPEFPINRNTYEWIQADFGQLMVVTQVETQGRFGNGQGQEYAEWYKLQYQRVDGGKWFNFTNATGSNLFKGNENTYNAEARSVNPPIIARKIRVVPYSEHERTVCMRIELHGCPRKDGIISYTIPQGDKRGSEVDLYDFTYDGENVNGILSGGLGQLVDGATGEDNFRSDAGFLNKKGYQWVGWKNESEGRPPVELIFEFNSTRNFSQMRIHNNNMYAKDIRVFRKAILYFSLNGIDYQKTQVQYDYLRDPVMSYARKTPIRIPYLIGRFLKVHLYFDDRWILISEVEFESEQVDGNVTLHVQGPVETTTTTDATHYVGDQETPDKSLDDQYIGIIIGALAALILLLTGIVLLITVRKRKLKSNNNSKHVAAEPHHVMLDLNDLRAMNAPVAVDNGKVSNGNLYNSIATAEVDNIINRHLTLTNSGSVYQESHEPMLGRKLPDLPHGKPIHDSGTDTMTSREYAVPDLSRKINAGILSSQSNSTLMFGSEPPPPYPSTSGMTSSASYGVYHGDDMQGLSGNSLYAVPNNIDLLWKEEPSIIELPPENLLFVEKLGEGLFGEVHLCEALRITDYLEDDVLINRTGPSRSLLVAVKMLHSHADAKARSDFHREAKIMSRLKDPNVVQVIGVCTRADPMCVVVEYMQHGDLHLFLQRHTAAEATVSRRKNTSLLSYGALIYMATQISSGMKYLESLNMVHRDLAARNCLVGNNYTIKISDFGMSRSLYSGDYYRIEGKAVLPIRWMAWESLLLGKFSTKSDVWSFGVTVWEVLTFAKEQPFNALNDEAVIENCGHFYQNDRQECYLPQPANCPKEIYDLLMECWNREEVHRPSFLEIHMFLQRKNMGYDPLEETRQNTLRVGVPVV